jgi:hypothetical protein
MVTLQSEQRVVYDAIVNNYRLTRGLKAKPVTQPQQPSPVIASKTSDTKDKVEGSSSSTGGSSSSQARMDSATPDSGVISLMDDKAAPPPSPIDDDDDVVDLSDDTANKSATVTSGRASRTQGNVVKKVKASLVGDKKQVRHVFTELRKAANHPLLVRQRFGTIDAETGVDRRMETVSIYILWICMCQCIFVYLCLHVSIDGSMLISHPCWHCMDGGKNFFGDHTFTQYIGSPQIYVGVDIRCHFQCDTISCVCFKSKVVTHLDRVKAFGLAATREMIEREVEPYSDWDLHQLVISFARQSKELAAMELKES